MDNERLQLRNISRCTRRIALALGLALTASCTDSSADTNVIKQYHADGAEMLYEPSSYPSAVVSGEVPELDCETPAEFTRSELTNFLIDQDALNLSYAGDPRTLQSDLLDEEKTSDKLIGVMSRLVQYGFCNDAPFDVLMLNTNHTEKTVTGNTSQHVVGYAVDIRPREKTSGFAFPVYAEMDDVPLIDQPEAARRTELLRRLLLNDENRDDIRQVIVTGFNPNWNRGQYQTYNEWAEGVIYNHQEHIHIGVQP